MTTALLRPLAVAIPLAALVVGCSFADVRPDGVLSSSVPTDLFETGDAQLQSMVDAHGGRDQFDGFDVARVAAVDDWSFRIGRDFFTPLPQNRQAYDMQWDVGSGFTADMVFTDGRRSGDSVGVDGTDSYRIRDGRVRDRDRGNDVFYVGAIQYLIELPFRMTEADVIVSAGETMLDGVAVDLVLATWNQVEPHRDADQYLLYIDQATSTLVAAEYTLRDFGKGFQGFILYDGYEEFDGLLVSTQMDIGAGAIDSDRHVHTLTILDASFE